MKNALSSILYDITTQYQELMKLNRSLPERLIKEKKPTDAVAKYKMSKDSLWHELKVKHMVEFKKLNIFNEL